jgi:hypothetical protein
MTQLGAAQVQKRTDCESPKVVSICQHTQLNSKMVQFQENSSKNKVIMKFSKNKTRNLPVSLIIGISTSESSSRTSASVKNLSKRSWWTEITYWAVCTTKSIWERCLNRAWLILLDRQIQIHPCYLHSSLKLSQRGKKTRVPDCQIRSQVKTMQKSR